ncbi:hypothetical protein R0131_18355, partial [Clostridium sp. AL.422]|uniref:hypothetical protein n=1 Tax=Clostridium TaxID=1485 RepID=UPI00293DC539
TGKLSSTAPMVLHGRLCGRVGRCQVGKRLKIYLKSFLFTFKCYRLKYAIKIFYESHGEV